MCFADYIKVWDPCLLCFKPKFGYKQVSNMLKLNIANRRIKLTQKLQPCNKKGR